MAHLLKRFFLLLALLTGARSFVYTITCFATLSPNTEFALQQYTIGTALVVFIIIVYDRIRISRRQHS